MKKRVWHFGGKKEIPRKFNRLSIEIFLHWNFYEVGKRNENCHSWRRQWNDPVIFRCGDSWSLRTMKAVMTRQLLQQLWFGIAKKLAKLFVMKEEKKIFVTQYKLNELCDECRQLIVTWYAYCHFQYCHRRKSSARWCLFESAVLDGMLILSWQQ